MAIRLEAVPVAVDVAAGDPVRRGEFAELIGCLLDGEIDDDSLRAGCELPGSGTGPDDFTRLAAVADGDARDVIGGEVPDPAIAQLPAGRWQLGEVRIVRVDGVNKILTPRAGIDLV